MSYVLKAPSNFIHESVLKTDRPTDRQTDRPTDRPTDQTTDQVSPRSDFPSLKNKKVAPGSLIVLEMETFGASFEIIFQE